MRQRWNASPEWWRLIFILLAALTTTLVIGALFFTTTSSWASAGCTQKQSETKHAVSEGPISGGEFMSDTKLVVHWCWRQGEVYDVSQFIKNRWRNCIWTWCLNMQIRKSYYGYFTSPDHHKRVVTGTAEFCQDFFWVNCAGHDVVKFAGYVAPGGETSFNGGPYSGGGGGGELEVMPYGINMPNPHEREDPRETEREQGFVIPKVDVTPPGEGTEYSCLLCGEKHTRITAMLDACLPKYALVPWAEKIGQEAMWKVLRANPELNLMAARERIKHHMDKLTAEDRKEAGGDRGGIVHEYLEDYIAVGTPGDPDSFPGEIRGYLRQLCGFLVDYEPEFLGSEFYLTHCQLKYAGRCDGICKIHRQPPRRNKPIDLTGKTVLFDLKTNALGRVYAPGHLYQVAGYRLAWNWLGGEPLDHEIVVAVGTDSYQVKVSSFEPTSFAELALFYHSMKTEMAR